MIVIRQVDPVEALPVYWVAFPSCGVAPSHWDAFCKHRGYVTFVAERDGAQVGFAVAESQPRGVHVLNLEGDTGACRRLLERLVMLSGERDMSGWVPIVRKDIRQMLCKLGFQRQHRKVFQGCASYLYRWNRNEDVEV